MRVTFRCDSGVTFLRHVETVEDCDRELRAACTLIDCHRTHGQVRLLRNMWGLVDELLTARSALLARDELAAIRACWWNLPGADEPVWPQSEGASS